MWDYKQRAEGLLCSRIAGPLVGMGNRYVTGIPTYSTNTAPMIWKPTTAENARRIGAAMFPPKQHVRSGREITERVCALARQWDSPSLIFCLSPTPRPPYSLNPHP